MPLNIMKLFFIGFIALLTACGGGGGGGGGTPLKGKLDITILGNDGITPIQGARISIFDDANAVVTTATTNIGGNAVISLNGNIYTVRVQAQGFETSPPQTISAIPFTIVNRETLPLEIQLDPLADLTATASIFGNADIANALIVAEETTLGIAASGITDKNGNYVLFNLVPGTYTVKAFKAGYLSSSIEPDYTVVDADKLEVNLNVTAHTSGSLSGQITFLAVANGVVDITLLHPVTKDPIPGLTTENSGNLYYLNNVPAGDYLAWATFENDDYVMDPDWVNKNGGYPDALAITMPDSDHTKDFSITGSIALVSPTNTADQVTPLTINTLTPAFSWEAYPSTKHYVIEVFNLQGQSIWGGYTFDVNTEDSTFKHPDIGTDLTASFNFDGSATTGLVDGQMYMWRVYAFNDASPKIAISSSEQQMGIFKVVLP